MKNTKKISSSFIALFAILILFVSSFSVAFTNNIEIKKQENASKKSGTKKKTDSNFHFSKSTIEAVFSQLITSFDSEAVIFYKYELQPIIKEKALSYIKFFTRQIYLEVLFEHLNAPNAP